MKKIVVYQCEICGTEFDSENSALDCENRITPLPKYKVGQKFKNNFDEVVEITGINYVPHGFFYDLEERKEDGTFLYRESAFGNEWIEEFYTVLR